jgi:hypothetical protein
MRLSISRSRESIWVWLFWGLGTYFALESGPFLIAGRVLKRPAHELAGPYLAFAAPAVILLPLIWWLRKWEEQGASPKRVARGWGLSMVLFGIAIAFAVFYSGIKLHLMEQRDAVEAGIPLKPKPGLSGPPPDVFDSITGTVFKRRYRLP